MTLEEILEKFESSKPGSDFSISAFGKGYSEINLKWNGSQINLYDVLRKNATSLVWYM